MPKLHSTLLGFDFGMRKIGVAVGQTVSNTAQPLAILRVQDGIPNWDEILALVKEWKPDALVIGIPYQMNGDEQETTFAARKFARRLEAKCTLRVYLAEERLTTQEAKFELRQQHKKSSQVDNYSAVLILESWLRENHHESPH